MNFIKLALSHRDLFLKYLGEYNFHTYEYSFTTLYLWRKYLDIEFAIYKNILIVRKKCSNIGNYFVEPLGYKDEDLEEIVCQLNNLKRENNMEYLFRDVEKPFLNKLINIFQNKLEYYEDIDNFDYIYNTNDLVTLTGAKYRKRRNRYKSFVNNYRECYFKPIEDEQTKKECIALAEEWYIEYHNRSEETYYELIGISELLENLDFLKLRTIAIYYKNSLIGFAIGEVLNNKMAVIHIEKCNRRFRGVYEYLNKTFIDEFFYDVSLINKEEDLGEAGLREAKMEYRPVKLEKKYIVNLK